MNASLRIMVALTSIAGKMHTVIHEEGFNLGQILGLYFSLNKATTDKFLAMIFLKKKRLDFVTKRNNIRVSNFEGTTLLANFALINFFLIREGVFGHRERKSSIAKSVRIATHLRLPLYRGLGCHDHSRY